MGKAEVPSLISLCLDAIKKELTNGGDGYLPEVYEIPSSLFHMLVMQLPPVALERLQRDMPYEDLSDYEYNDDCSGSGRKRGRNGIFDKAWKILFTQRWPELTTQVKPDDWQQIYWQEHLQNCLDKAAETAVLPSFGKCIGNIELPDAILNFVGYEVQTNHSTHNYSKLIHHCHQFGFYARCLRLQNVMCNSEICSLLSNSRLQSLVFHCIRSKEHVDGLCGLLKKNIKTLVSVEFIYCKFSSTYADSICASLCEKSMHEHRIQNFSMKSSSFVESNMANLPLQLVSFLSYGRSFDSVKFRDCHLNRKFGKKIIDSLLDASSKLSIIDLSENNMTGWLSGFLSGSSCLSSAISRSFESLCLLNIRGNNLNEDDAENLRHVLSHMPKLETLELGDNPIEDDGLRSLMPYFHEVSERCLPFTNLDLENCELTSSGVTALLDTLLTLQRPLNSLSIAENSLGSDIATPLGKFLGGSIRLLNIGGIGLGPFGFQKLQEGLSEGVNLVNINISKNRGGVQTANFLSRLIIQAPDLVTVNAAYNFMPIESLSIICSALKKSQCKLMDMDFTGNKWDFQPLHASMLAEVQHNGKPIIHLSSSLGVCTFYDDDP